MVNKIFLSYEAAFLHPDIAEIITLWSQVDETAVPMEERWYRKIYSFCKGNQATIVSTAVRTVDIISANDANVLLRAVSDTVLIAWICGEEAKFMEKLKMNVVADTCTMILRKFLADPYIPKPKSCLL